MSLFRQVDRGRTSEMMKHLMFSMCWICGTFCSRCLANGPWKQIPRSNPPMACSFWWRKLEKVNRNWTSWFYRVFLTNLDTLFQNVLLSRSQDSEKGCVVKYNKMFFGKYDSVSMSLLFACVCFKPNVGWTYTSAVCIILLKKKKKNRPTDPPHFYHERADKQFFFGLIDLRNHNKWTVFHHEMAA